MTSASPSTQSSSTWPTSPKRKGKAAKPAGGKAKPAKKNVRHLYKGTFFGSRNGKIKIDVNGKGRVFDVDDPKDMRRLLQGYTEARRAGRFARPGSEVLAELRRAIEVH